MELTYYIITVLCTMVNTYILYKYYHYLFQNRRNSFSIELCAYITCFCINIIVYFFINIPIITLISSLTTYTLLSFNYIGKIKQKIFSGIFCAFLFIFVETAVLFLTTTIPINIFDQNAYYEATGQIFTTIFTFLAVEIIGRKRNINNTINLPISYWLAILITPISSFAIMLYFMIELPYGLFGNTFCCLLFLFINVSVFSFYDKLVDDFSARMEKQHLEQQNQYYTSLLRSIKASTEATRKFQHDQDNHFIVLQSMLKDQKYDDLSAYLQKLTSQCAANKVISSGNTVIDSILNFKIQEAKTKDIKIKTNVTLLPEFNISPTALTIIIGNLLDNAIEAVEKAQSEVPIKITMFYDSVCFFIIISNVYINEIVKENKKKFKTTKKDTENHGFGLQNVEKAVESNGGSMQIEIQKNIFTTKIALFAKAESN